MDVEHAEDLPFAEMEDHEGVPACEADPVDDPEVVPDQGNLRASEAYSNPDALRVVAHQDLPGTAKEVLCLGNLFNETTEVSLKFFFFYLFFFLILINIISFLDFLKLRFVFFLFSLFQHFGDISKY